MISQYYYLYFRPELKLVGTSIKGDKCPSNHHIIALVELQTNSLLRAKFCNATIILYEKLVHPYDNIRIHPGNSNESKNILFLY